jgi:hypothetical protein
MRVRIELLDVYCRDTEDVTGADTLYLTGGVSDGRQIQPVLTNRVWINNRQTRFFSPEHRLLFDADIPANKSVHIGLTAWDEDAAKDWAKHKEWVQRLSNEIANQLEQLPRDPQSPQTQEPDPGKVAAAILRGGVAAVNFFASRDKDDELSNLMVDIPVGTPGNEIREWQCKGRWMGGLAGWSTWDYNIRYRISQLPDSTPLSEARYGSIVKLRHLASIRNLHSHSHNYNHPNSSRQQQVTAFEAEDDNDLWMIKAAHGTPRDYKYGQPVQHGDIIRLEHVLTRRNLHSHGGIASPITRQQEVTCYGDNGEGDDNDNWRIELEAGGQWNTQGRARLIHVNTNHALHSHFGFEHAAWTMNQQEVTGFSGRDDNDWWTIAEVR